MVMTDPISDMLTRIRNAQKAKFLKVSFPHSKVKLDVCKVLHQEGYISDYEILDNDINNHKTIELKLKYIDRGTPAIVSLDKVSKPGKRIYSSIKDLKEYYKGLGIYILSTSKGIISDRDAVKYRVGGEIICKVF
jgi:small subunit ribosomal protein S8